MPALTGTLLSTILFLKSYSLVRAGWFLIIGAATQLLVYVCPYVILSGCGTGLLLPARTGTFISPALFLKYYSLVRAGWFLISSAVTQLLVYVCPYVTLSGCETGLLLPALTGTLISTILFLKSYSLVRSGWFFYY